MSEQDNEIQVLRGFHQSREGALNDIRDQGYWPSVYVSDRMDELPLHWHDQDVFGYVIEGSSYLLDADGRHLALRAGDKLIIPRGVLHAEGEVTERMVYLIGTAEPRNLRDALELHYPPD